MFFLHQNKVCTVKVQFDHTCKSKGMTLLEVHFVSMLLLFLEIFFRFLPKSKIRYLMLLFCRSEIEEIHAVRINIQYRESRKAKKTVNTQGLMLNYFY